MFCYDELSVSIFNTLQLGFFSPNVPVLVYYSHLTAIIVSVLLSFFILFNNKTLEARILVAISLIFSFLAVIDIFLWTQIDARVVMFLWSFWLFLFITIFTLSLYFLRVFVTKKDVSFTKKIIASVVLLFVLVLSTSHFNLEAFDVAYCYAVEGPIVLNIVFAISFVIFLITVIYGFFATHKTIDPAKKKQIKLVTIGTGSFLLFFAGAAYIASIANLFSAEPDTFLIEQYGYFGMTIFIAFLTYVIVRYKAFNIKLIATQALIVALVILIGSQFFFIQSNTNRILNSVALVLSLGFGYLLVKSVKREIEAKEKVEKLAKELEQSNLQQESLIRFISHEMKGYLTVSAGLLSSIVEGDFNPINEQLRSSSEMALVKVREGVRSVVEILTNANAKKGTLAYTMKPFDLGKIVTDSIEKLTPEAKEKNLIIEKDIKDTDNFMVMGDAAQISEHVIRNLIDNSIKYTPTGSVHIALSKKDGKVTLSIKDTGVGITKDDMKRLFVEGGHGENSRSINVHSTGYGLAIAKRIVDAHKGRIWAESEGEGKGSQFYVELPESK